MDWLLLLFGTVLGIVALTADLVGLGDYPGFGWRQMLATAVAIVLVVAAALRIVRRESRRPQQ